MYVWCVVCFEDYANNLGIFLAQNSFLIFQKHVCSPKSFVINLKILEKVFSYMNFVCQIFFENLGSLNVEKEWVVYVEIFSIFRDGFIVALIYCLLRYLTNPLLTSDQLCFCALLPTQSWNFIHFCKRLNKKFRFKRKNCHKKWVPALLTWMYQNIPVLALVSILEDRHHLTLSTT